MLAKLYVMYTSTFEMALVVGSQEVELKLTSMKVAALGSHVVAQKSLMKSVKHEGQR